MKDQDLLSRPRIVLAHQKLVAWQRADDLYIDLHHLTRSYPSDERFGLTSQLRRAAYSVPANIVEGVGRTSKRDRLRFLDIAASSLLEVCYCLHVSRRLGYVTDDAHDRFERAVREVAAPLHGLRRSLSASAD